MEEPDLRQIIIARKDLKMRAGKLAAQVAHASVAALLSNAHSHVHVTESAANPALVIPLDPDLQAWLSGQFKKICVYVQSEEELLSFHEKALNTGMRCALIRDNGLTEFGGVPTYTALAVGPHPKARLDPLTGQLPLY